MKTVDVAIIGAGIAGASVAWGLDDACAVLLLDQEAQAGYHTTGRSAAFYAPTYGGPLIAPLTKASRAFFDLPGSGFANGPLLHDRGALYIAQEHQLGEVDRMLAAFAGALALQRYDAAQTLAMAPMLRPGYAAQAVFDPACRDIDVAALHAGMLRGRELWTQAEVTGMAHAQGRWVLETRRGRVAATVVVNAAGSWGDALAVLAGAQPVGLIPRRRTMVALAAGDRLVDPAWPLVLDIGGQFYFKPQSGLIWASPGDETADVAGDVQPDALDVAITLERLTAATDFEISAVRRSWAGLRTFTADRLPVYGFDPVVPNFYWCVGQGGWGIQTAPAAGQLCAAQIKKCALPESLAQVDAARFAPDRFSRL